ncbi:MAG: ABC transporter permease subunit [Roseobacter sp.]
MEHGKGRLGQIFDHVILCLGVFLMLFPVMLMIMASTQGTQSIALNGLRFSFGQEAMQNYREILTLKAGFTDQISALAMMKNSLIIATSLASLTSAISMCAAYAMVYFRFRFALLLFWLTMLTLMLPLESRFVTTYQVASTLGLVNTLPGMILPALSLALGTLFFRQLFLSIPNEYLEAAKLDGAGPIKFFWDILLPLSWRRGGAIFVVSFMIGWHQYLWPVLLSTDESTFTVVRGMRLIGIESGPGMALAVLTLLPPLCLVFFFQRYFFQSLGDPKESF